jgi:hypothetical protein
MNGQPRDTGNIVSRHNENTKKRKQKTKIKQNKTKNAHKNTKHTHIHKHNTENQKAENVEQHESTKKVSTRFILRFRI